MKITVCSVQYVIKELTFKPDDDCVGRIYPNKLVIEIEKRLAPDRKKQALFHEIFHAIANEYNLNLSDDTVDTLASAVLKLVQDNRGVL